MCTIIHSTIIGQLEGKNPDQMKHCGIKKGIFLSIFSNHIICFGSQQKEFFFSSGWLKFTISLEHKAMWLCTMWQYPQKIQKARKQTSTKEGLCKVE
jgi:hypothetical protein